MGIARHDEGIDADILILLDPRRNDLGIADQRRSSAAADEPHAGPEVRADLELVTAAAMQIGHALLPDRVHARKDLLRRGDGVVGHVANQVVCGLPGVCVSLSHDHMQADAERKFAPTFLGAGPDPRNLLGDLGRRLAPGQIFVDRLGGDYDTRIR